MNFQHVHSQELIYYLYQRIKFCINAYSKDFISTKYNNHFEELYKMERDILIWMIREIVKTEEYTLKGISYHTRIPFDIICDASIGMQKQISFTLWFKVAELFLQVKKKNCFHSSGDQERY